MINSVISHPGILCVAMISAAAALFLPRTLRHLATAWKNRESPANLPKEVRDDVARELTLALFVIALALPAAFLHASSPVPAILPKPWPNEIAAAAAAVAATLLLRRKLSRRTCFAAIPAAAVATGVALTPATDGFPGFLQRMAEGSRPTAASVVDDPWARRMCAGDPDCMAGAFAVAAAASTLSGDDRFGGAFYDDAVVTVSGNTITILKRGPSHPAEPFPIQSLTRVRLDFSHSFIPFVLSPILDGGRTVSFDVEKKSGSTNLTI